MDRNIRRVLYTALVAGGLVVVGASSAYAAGDGLSDPVVAAVVDGTLGGDGLVDDLLTGGLPGGAEGLLPEGPDTGQPGTDEPGTDPGTDGPGTIDPPGTEEPGTEEPGTEEPGTGEPGTGEPGTGEPGTGEPGTGEPGADAPGADRPGTGRPGSGGPGADHGTDRPGTGGHDAGPRTERPGTGKPGTDGPDITEPHTTEPRTAQPRTTEPHTGYSGGELPSGGAAGPIVVGPGSGGSSTGTPSTDDSGPRAQEDHGRPAATPGPGESLPAGGVDLAWGGKAGPVLTSSSGTMLAGGLDEDLRGTSTEPEAEAEPAQQVPDASLAETGHMITGQLSLISLLLGLGIAALRMRRR
ncbi:hypothetical protein APR04_004778 [Promicromonospora umidemergens]|uniref:Uncharacterized protein n=1 Tax=Promicromonospora umidemergens TaxID=629679 RepID=A0ABP8WLD4_9MICO|nr:hypothetical protein [Promicromonospora umidemergens]MCP2285842.1 hypothetical protein [Promicromonospora umidemergens]